jgi:hypothetical protein
LEGVRNERIPAPEIETEEKAAATAGHLTLLAGTATVVPIKAPRPAPW